MTDPRLQTILDLYAAFGRADIAAVLAVFAPEAQVSFNVQKPAAPWHAPASGAGIADFFRTVGESVEFEAFEPLELVAGSASVAARVHMRYRVRSSGAVVDQVQVHWWTFEGSKVSSLVHFEDTAQVASAAA